MSANPGSPQTPQNSGLSRIFAEAAQALGMGDYSKGIELLERAYRLDPGNFKIPLDLGYAQALSYNYAAAQRWYEKAIQLAPNKTEVLLAIADHWREMQRIDATCQVLEQVLEQKEIPLPAYVDLAENYLLQHRFDKAEEIAERAIQEHREHEGALFIRARVHRELRQFEPAEKRLRELLAKAGCEAEARVAALYELGNVLDQQKRFDDAMAAFLDAKALMRMTAEPATKTLRMKQATMKQIQESITPQIIQRWRKAGAVELLPPRKLALLCGHPGSGSASLESALGAHPGIACAHDAAVFQSKAYPQISRAGAGNKSFLAGLEWLNPRNMRQLRSDYFHGMEAVLGQPVSSRLLLDINPALTFDIPALCRIFPETRFITAIRDPRDVCLSCFMQTSPMLPDTVPWLTLEGTMKHYAATNDFWQALKPCLDSAAFEVRYESTAENLEATARCLIEFLGLPWDDQMVKAAEPARSELKNSIGQWRNYQKYFEPHLEVLAPTLRSLGYE